MTMLRLVMACATGLLSGPAFAGTTNVAVAANFTEAAKQIAKEFKAKTGHEAVLSFGASGQFFTQIKESAPYKVFLSADEERPKALVDDGLAVASSRFTYAVGKIVLWSADPNAIRRVATLRDNAFRKIAIANPAAAPYGVAAIETLKALGIYEAVQPKIVMGNSIAQTFQFVWTGNAELGFVALSQLAGDTRGSRWEPPQDLYTPIKQDAVLLNSGADDDASKAFMTFLRGPDARAVIERFGYGVDGKSGS